MRLLGAIAHWSVRGLVVVCLLALVVVGAAAPAGANVIYQYTGQPFDSLVAPYTASDFVTVRLTLANPIVPEFSGLIDIEEEILAWEVGDGQQTFGSGGAATLIQFALVFETDNDGLPVRWDFDFWRDFGSPTQADWIATCQGPSPSIPPGGTGSLGCPNSAFLNRDDGFIDAMQGGFGACSSDIGQPGCGAGTWTITPEPSRLSLVALGLLGFEALRRRRRRQAL